MYLHLCARYGRRLELCGYRDQLEALGHTVTSDWLDGEHSDLDTGRNMLPVDLSAQHAQQDLADIDMAQAVIAFTEEPPETKERPPLRIPPAAEVEEWKPVAGSRLGYMVSSFGRIRNGDGEFVTGKIHHKGYRHVLPNGKHDKVQAVHQLVAAAFLGPCPAGYEIDHCDTHKANNWKGNLEYVTHAENIRRAALYGLYPSQKGEANGRAKLTWEDVADIRAALATGQTKASLSRQYEVTDTTICRIGQGKLWPVAMEKETYNRGGKDFEFGYAYARGKLCAVVGPLQHIFCTLPHVQHYPTWEVFYAAIASLSAEVAP